MKEKNDKQKRKKKKVKFPFGLTGVKIKPKKQRVIRIPKSYMVAIIIVNPNSVKAGEWTGAIKYNNRAKRVIIEE